MSAAADATPHGAVVLLARPLTWVVLGCVAALAWRATGGRPDASRAPAPGAAPCAAAAIEVGSGACAADVSAPAVFSHAPTGPGWVTVRDMNMARPPYRVSYEKDNGSGMYYYGPADVAGVSARTDAADEPASAPSAVRTTLPAGWRDGGGSMSRWETRGFPANDGRLYLAYTIRPSANWWHPRDAGWKNWYLRPRGGDRNSIHFLAWVDVAGNGPGTMLPKFGTQWGGKAVDEAWIHPTYANRLRPGQWNVVEFLITPNTDGRYDGRLQIWINGAAAPLQNPSHGEGINWFLKGQPVGWDGVWWDMIFAHPGAVPAAEQWVEHGHVLIKVHAPR